MYAHVVMSGTNYLQWVLKPENSLVWHQEVLGWLNKYSGITAEQEAQEEIGVGVTNLDIHIL